MYVAAVETTPDVTAAAGRHAPGPAGDRSARHAARMVGLVREARGWTQTELAQASGLSQAWLSKLENGLADADAERLEAVASALGCPPALLASDDPVRGLEVSCLHHRRRSSKLTVATTRRIEGLAHLTRLTVEGLLDGTAAGPDAALRRLDPDEHGGPAEVARRCRAAWRVPTGPVDSMTSLLERLGVVVVVRDLPSASQDAVSSWPADRPPVMLVNTGLPGDRQRFTLAHELGHLVMHLLPGDDQEREANRFAAELLVPGDEIEPALRGLTTRDLRRLMELKARWGVSIGVLVQRAKDLDCISERQFKEFRIRLARMGWSTAEPVPVPAETPVAVADAIALRRARGDDDRRLAAAALMTPEAFRRHYLGQSGAIAGNPQEAT